jgi:hypothetical protein
MENRWNRQARPLKSRVARLTTVISRSDTNLRLNSMFCRCGICRESGRLTWEKVSRETAQLRITARMCIASLRSARATRRCGAPLRHIGPSARSASRPRHIRAIRYLKCHYRKDRAGDRCPQQAQRLTPTTRAKQRQMGCKCDPSGTATWLKAGEWAQPRAGLIYFPGKAAAVQLFDRAQTSNPRSPSPRSSQLTRTAVGL